MARLEDLKVGASFRGLTMDNVVNLVSLEWYGDQAVKVTYEDVGGKTDNRLVYPNGERSHEVVRAGRVWAFDGDGALLRLVSEAHRLQLAHLFDPHLAIHTSLIEPLRTRSRQSKGRCCPANPCAFSSRMTPAPQDHHDRPPATRADRPRPARAVPHHRPRRPRRAVAGELSEKSNLHFDILTRDRIESSYAGNYFSDSTLSTRHLFGG